MIAKLAKAIGIPTAGVWGALIALAVILLPLAKCAYDNSIVDAHDTEVNLNAAIEDRKADTNAAEQREADLERRNQELDQLTRAQENAQTDADRRLAFHRCLRLQQRARENGLKPPTCV